MNKPVSPVCNKHPPTLFTALDRTEFDWPDQFFMPSAPVVLLASEQLVRQATSDCPLICPHRPWLEEKYDGSHWIRIEANRTIIVWPHKKWWLMRRHVSEPNYIRVEALAFVFGPAPICTDSLDAAKKLAVYYHFLPIQAACGMKWAEYDS